MNKIVAAYKPIGMTPLEIVNRCKARYGYEKVAYAGRLDPMAHGLLILMIEDACRERDRLQQLDKTYRFKLVLGVETDSYDILGIAEIGNPDKLKNVEIPQIVGEIDQPYPPFSSFRVQGKPLFYWARENKLSQIELPSKKIEIKKFEILNKSEVEIEVLIDEFSRQIQLVKGDFRQKEIIDSWQRVKEGLQSAHVKKLPVYEIEVSVSSGTYIRSLAERIGKELNTSAIAFEIYRTKAGEFKVEDAERF